MLVVQTIYHSIGYFVNRLYKRTSKKGKMKMKRLNITKEQFNRSNYFQKKYGKLKYVSESGKL